MPHHSPKPVTEQAPGYQNRKGMNKGNGKVSRSVFDATREVTRRFRLSVREALLDHKRAGNPVAIWRDGKVVIVPPEEIEISKNEASASPTRDPDERTAS